MHLYPISTQCYNKHCSSNEWRGKCIYRLALLSLLAAWVFLVLRNISLSLFKQSVTTWICVWGWNNEVRLKFCNKLGDSVPFWSVSMRAEGWAEGCWEAAPQSAAVFFSWDWPSDVGNISSVKLKLNDLTVYSLCCALQVIQQWLYYWCDHIAYLKWPEQQ